jgi:hypothetical protein
LHHQSEMDFVFTREGTLSLWLNPGDSTSLTSAVFLLLRLEWAGCYWCVSSSVL